MKIKYRNILTKDDFGRLERGKFYGVFAEPNAGKTHMMKTGAVQYCEENNKTMLMLAIANLWQNVWRNVCAETRTSLKFIFFCKYWNTSINALSVNCLLSRLTNT